MSDPTSRGQERAWPAVYARWRASRLGAITDRIEQALIFDAAGRLAGKRVLDVGCGDGTLAVSAAEKGAQVVGLDASAAMIEIARANVRRRGAEIGFVLGRAEQLPFAGGSFDLVVSVTTLCFVADAPRALGEMARVLKPGGSLLIGELGGRSLWAASRRLRGWLGNPIWAVARFWTAARLRELVAETGLTAGPVLGAVYFPPSAWFAGVMAPIDRAIGRVMAAGAAFLLVPARKPIGGQVAEAIASPEPRTPSRGGGRAVNVPIDTRNASGHDGAEKPQALEIRENPALFPVAVAGGLGARAAAGLPRPVRRGGLAAAFLGLLEGALGGGRERFARAMRRARLASIFDA